MASVLDRGPLVVIAAIAIISTACASTPASGGTGSGSSNTPTTREQAVKFAECIRSHGYKDFPDPDASGDFGTFGISVSPEVWAKALDACKDLQPPGSFSSNRSPEEQAASLKFAQCIRDNGVTDFPDPANGDPLIDTNKIPSVHVAGGMDRLRAALAKCRDLLNQTLGSGQ